MPVRSPSASAIAAPAQSFAVRRGRTSWVSMAVTTESDSGNSLSSEMP